MVGYGGWNDVFTRTLIELIGEGNNNFEILWCFYESNVEQIQAKYAKLLNSLDTAVGQRVVLYSGIDCHRLFPDALSKITLAYEGRNPLREGRRIPERKAPSGFACDTPPNNLHWVGREEEIGLLSKGGFKTCFITGIGGQGKSGLASHFIRTVEKEKLFEMWDWRDCKEEDNKIQTIIISQIQRLSRGRYLPYKINGENINDLINLFFQTLGQRKVAFVYDNVDRYIDLVEFKPIGAIKQLFLQANNLDHKSMFIFTCRPHINYTGSGFQEVGLNALPLEKTIELFKKYNPPIRETKLVSIATTAHELTQGHPLWLSLVAAQANRGQDVVEKFLNNYKLNKSLRPSQQFSVAEEILDVAWKTLNPKQQILLRGMAELVTSLNREELETIFSSELSFNQFDKAFKALDRLNLLVVKSFLDKKDLYELHPLVKEYIINKYKKNERSKYIMLLVSFYDKSIFLIKPKLDYDSPLSFFEKYTQKAELQINNGDFQQALQSIHEILSQIHKAGFVEEYIRICNLLFTNINLFQAVAEEYTSFHDVFGYFVTDLIERGKFQEAKEYLVKYEEVIPGKSIAYLSFCALNAYYHWYKEEFEVAIDWAEKGMDLQTKTGVGKDIEIAHKLALALRDTRKDENIQKALDIFLRGEQLDEVLSDSFPTQNFGSHYFGEYFARI